MRERRTARSLAAAWIALTILLLPLLVPQTSAASPSVLPPPVYVPETGHNVSEPFLSVWRRHGIDLMGLPITEPLEEDGRTVQYFERVVMEHWPEHAGTRYKVQLRLLGNSLVIGRNEDAFYPLNEHPHEEDGTFFPETGHTLSGLFADYWRANGGLYLFGYPISESFEENGRTVQYFERARFEHWPEHSGTRYEVQLGHLGRDAAARSGIDSAPAPRIDGALHYNDLPPPRTVQLPILMYHRIGAEESRYEISLWRFEQQIAWLAENGYTAISLNELYDAIYYHAPLPDKPVVLTFDDAFPGHWEAAAILEKYEMKGVFFILLHPPRLSDDQIRDLAARGHEIGSHTFEHLDLRTLDDATLQREVRDSRTYLLDTGQSYVDFFAYPGGNYDQRVIEAVEAAGYRGAVAAWGGSECTPEKRWHQPRIEVAGTMTLDEFASLVERRSSQ